jgi:hypothetical protein
MLSPGDVLVIDEGRENNTGSFGHNMSLQARNRGAAGLVFGSDGEHRHYGFYPSAGQMRLTRFEGPNVFLWTVLKQFNHLLIRTKKVDFIEQFNEKLLVKQEGENLNIVDVHSGSVISVSRTEFVTPSAFIFLYENHLFLTFRGRQVLVWNFKGEQVTAFEDHELWHAETNTSNIFITAKQDYIISYCRP